MKLIFDNIYITVFINHSIVNIEIKIIKGKNKVYLYEIISCNKKKFTIKDIKELPTIYFYHYNFNYTFEMTYKELFKEINNNIFFLILNNIGTVNKDIWKLGKIFLYKYHFSFNQDSKKIVFYNIKSNSNLKRNKEKENLKNKNKFNINFIFFLFYIICLFFVIYILNKIIKKSRKMRVNELHDELDYQLENINIDKRSNFMII